MASIEQVESAFLKAHNAGDTAAAQVLATEVKRLRASASAATPTTAAPAEETGGFVNALLSGFGTPVKELGKTARALGAETIGSALEATPTPKGYVSAGERFMNPREGDLNIGGFAFAYLPRAAVEQAGQLAGSIVSRAGGAALGGMLAGPGGAAVGAIAGPAAFGAAQVIGSTAFERAKNNNREKPNAEDLLFAMTTGAGSGLVDAFGVDRIMKAGGPILKRLASGSISEFSTEFAQSIIEQLGGTAGTEKGVDISGKQAVGEGLIGGVTGGVASAALGNNVPQRIAEEEKEAPPEPLVNVIGEDVVEPSMPVGGAIGIKDEEGNVKVATIDSVKSVNGVPLVNFRYHDENIPGGVPGYALVEDLLPSVVATDVPPITPPPPEGNAEGPPTGVDANVMDQQATDAKRLAAKGPKPVLPGTTLDVFGLDDVAKLQEAAEKAKADALKITSSNRKLTSEEKKEVDELNQYAVEWSQQAKALIEEKAYKPEDLTPESIAAARVAIAKFPVPIPPKQDLLNAKVKTGQGAPQVTVKPNKYELPPPIGPLSAYEQYKPKSLYQYLLDQGGIDPKSDHINDVGAGVLNKVYRTGGMSVRKAVNLAEKAGYLGDIKVRAENEPSTIEDMDAFANAMRNANETFSNDVQGGGISSREQERARRADLAATFGNNVKGEGDETIQYRAHLHTTFGIPIDETKELNVHQAKEKIKQLGVERSTKELLEESQLAQKQEAAKLAAVNAASEKKTQEEVDAQAQAAEEEYLATERAGIQADSVEAGLDTTPKQERFAQPIQASTPAKMTAEEERAEAERLINEAQFKISQPTSAASSTQPRRYEDALSSVELNSLEKLLRKFDPKGRISLRLREKIEAMVDGKLEEVDGKYLRNLIEVSLQAGDKVGVLNHEIIHALKDLGLFTGQEWSALTKAVLKNQALMDNVRARYQGVKGMNEEKLIEEAIADLHAQWQDGRYKIGGIIRSALERISSFVKAFGNALRGAGFNSDPTVGSVFRDVSKGTIGMRDVRPEVDPFGMYSIPQPATPQQASNTANKVLQATGGSPTLASKTISRPVLYFATMQGVARHFPVIARFQHWIQARSERETALINEGEKSIERMTQLDYKPRKQIEAVMEFARLTNTNVTPMNGRITVVLPQNYTGILGRPGEVFMLDKKQSEIFMEIKKYFKNRWNQYGQAIAGRWGYTGAWDEAAIQAAIADAQAQGNNQRAKNFEYVLAIYADAKARENYVPFSRTGDEGFTVRNKLTGEVVYFDMVDTKNVWGGLTGSNTKKNEIITKKFAELQRKFSELDAKGDPLYEVKNDPVSQSDIEKLDVSLIEKLLAVTNIADKKDRNSAMNNILDALKPVGIGKTEVKNAIREGLLDSVKKAQRAGFTKESRNTPGYSTNFLQSIIDYNRTTASVVSGIEYGQQTDEAYDATQSNKVPENIRKYAERINEYLDSDERLIGQIKQYGFWANLWGSVSSALVNLSQTPTITATQIAGWGGVPAAGRTMKLSVDMLRALSFNRRQGITLDPKKIKFNSPEEGLAFMDAYNRGRINPTITQDLQGTAPDNLHIMSSKLGSDQSAKIQKVIWNIADIGSSAFYGAEQVNRATAWLAAYREAQRPGAVDKFKKMYAGDARVGLIEKDFGLTPQTIADFFVNETQFIGGKIDRPELLRGAGGVVFQFKQYPMNYLRILKNNMTSAGPEGKIAGTMMLMALTAFGGLLGLPFADDLVDSYEFIMKISGQVDPMIEQEMRDVLTGIGASSEWAEAATRGPARFLGVDVSKRIGQGEILPEANPLMNMPVFGATIGKIMEAQKRFSSDQPFGGAVALASVAVPKGPSDALRGMLQLPNEGYQTQRGDVKVQEPHLGQFAAKTLGFQPSEFASIQERDYFGRRLKYRTKEAENKLSTSLASKLKNSIIAREKGDSEQADKLMREFVDRYQRAAVNFGSPSVPMDEKVRPPSMSSVQRRAMLMMHPELVVRSARVLKRPALSDLYDEEED